MVLKHPQVNGKKMHNNKEIFSINYRILSDTERQSKPVSRRMKAKHRRIEFKKLFIENKYRFDMTCDNCPASFESLNDARTHYANEHNNSKGYIKCCQNKLTYRCEVVKHLYRHLEPNKFKLVI